MDFQYQDAGTRSVKKAFMILEYFITMSAQFTCVTLTLTTAYLNELTAVCICTLAFVHNFYFGFDFAHH